MFVRVIHDNLVRYDLNIRLVSEFKFYSSFRNVCNVKSITCDANLACIVRSLNLPNLLSTHSHVNIVSEITLQLYRYRSAKQPISRVAKVFKCAEPKSFTRGVENSQRNVFFLNAGASGSETFQSGEIRCP